MVCAINLLRYGNLSGHGINAIRHRQSNGSGSMSKQPEALRLANYFDYHGFFDSDKSAAAELRRLHQHELALIEWLEKTHWVQVGAQPGELGRHRADVIKQRFDRLHAANIDCVDHFNAIKAERDELLAVLKELQESASYWSEYDVPIGIVDRINTAIANATGEQP
jgi:hypothetical protein